MKCLAAIVSFGCLLVGAQAGMTTCSHCDGNDVQGVFTNIVATDIPGYAASEFKEDPPNDVHAVDNGGYGCIDFDVSFTGVMGPNDVDICSFSVKTLYVHKVELTCGGLYKKWEDLAGAPVGLHETIFNFVSKGDPQCSPHANHCKLCIETATLEAKVGAAAMGGCECCVDCEVGEWSDWGECDTSPRSCGDGVQKRTRPLLVPANDCGDDDCVTEETKTCTKDCCAPEDQEILDCKQHFDMIDSVKITPGGPAGEKVYTQVAKSAIRRCSGELWLAENSATGKNGYKITLKDPTDIMKVCITWKYCATVKVLLISGANVHDLPEAKHPDCTNCPMTCPETTDWNTKCWSLDSLGQLGAEDVTTVEFIFPDSGPSHEWKIKNIYLKFCPE